MPDKMSVQNIVAKRDLSLPEKDVAGKPQIAKTVQELNQAVDSSGGGAFMKLNLDSLMLAVMTQRAELLEGTLRSQVTEVRKKNDKLKETNDILASARAAKSNTTGDDKKTWGMPQEVKQFFKDNGISWNGKGGTVDPTSTYNLTGTQWDLALENIKGFSESLTSTSQLDMTKLQSTSGKFNQTFELMSQFISKYYRSGDNLIKNI